MEYPKKAQLVMFVIAALGCLLLAASELANAPPAHAQRAGNAEWAQSSLDFDTYRTRIEPIFLKTREGGVRCYDCHSIVATRLRLERLSEGSSSWTEQQSRRNFRVVSLLVTPAEPLQSRLLLHPLTPYAGGDPTHTGGKFWKSQDDPEWQMLADWVRAGSAPPPVEQPPSGSIQAPARDFEFFKTRVEPIFLK